MVSHTIKDIQKEFILVNERQVWFITRPERDPKFHREALIALAEATNNFTIKWSSNRQAHLKYEQTLSQHEIKRNNTSNDGSGGRTWAALLKTFAYIYTNENGYLKLTRIGQEILAGRNVRENITKQILTLQIPNAYFLESGFRPKFDKKFRIRPARFLIKLTNQPTLNYYLTKEEITYFALTAKNDNQLDSITEEILQFRNLDSNSRSVLLEEISKKYDHRQRSDMTARGFKEAHGDVSHTYMLICEYTGFVDYIRGESLRIDPSKSQQCLEEIRKFDNRYPFNSRYLISLERMAENNGLDINSYKASSYGEIKPATNKAKTNRKINQLLSEYPDLDSLSFDDLHQILMRELSIKEAEKYARELKKSSYSSLNTSFVEGYINETDNLEFENKTGEIFKALGFEVEMRPKPTTDVKTEIEILLSYRGENMGIIDAKNYQKNFTLSSALSSHMASEYLPNYNGYKNRPVTFFGYVTASKWSGEKNITKISSLVKRVIPEREIKGIMLSANVLLGFLDYCIDHELSASERVHCFLRAINNRAYSTIGEFLSTTQIIQ